MIVKIFGEDAVKISQMNHPIISHTVTKNWQGRLMVELNVKEPKRCLK